MTKYVLETDDAFGRFRGADQNGSESGNVLVVVEDDQAVEARLTGIQEKVESARARLLNGAWTGLMTSGPKLFLRDTGQL